MKSSLKKVTALLLSAVMAISLFGCGDGDTSSISQVDEHRPQYKDATAQKKVYKDIDGQFEYETVDWDGPEGYRIVVPDGNEAVTESAELLRDYYKTVNISLSIVTDKTAETANEILIGKTNRAESNVKLRDEDIKVEVKNGKLVIGGGHNVSVDSAVRKYIRLAPKSNQAFVFEIKTDFKATMLDGYEYVWGDEFEGTELDSSKWDLRLNMVGCEAVEVSKEENVVAVNEGRLKMYALHYFNNDRKGTKYRVPYGIVSDYKMNYTYGYAEIRARVPFAKGIWPSWWLSASYDSLTVDKYKSKNYGLEIDIFEVFDEFNVTPGLIKWYTSEFDYNTRYNTGGQAGEAVSLTTHYLDKENHKVYKMPETEIDKYHIYGFEWTPTEMAMYVDGEKYMTYDITKSFDLCDDLSGYHDPHSFRFNNHIFHQDISLANPSIDLSPESLPAAYFVDYIRLYQKPNQGEIYTKN